MHPGWTAVIVNYNGTGYLEACLYALSRTRVRPHDVIVVDNASTDDSLQELHGFPRVNVLPQPNNLGFAGGANVGLAAVETEFAMLLNPDVEVAGDFGDALLSSFASDPRIGALGALLHYPDGKTIQHAGGAIDRPLMTTRHLGYGSTDIDAFSTPAAVQFVTGGAMGLRLEAFRAVGGFDEQFSPVYYEDVDLCLRLRDAGWSVRVDPRLRALHHEGVTLQQSQSYFRHLHRNRLRFAVKHLSGDEWRDEFVPAEYARLRHELWTLDGDDWAERSGASALEAVMRGPTAPTQWHTAPVFPGPPPNVLASHLNSLRDLWDIRAEPRRSRFHWVARIQNWVNAGGQQSIVTEAFVNQRAFNAAVVRALEVQDQHNREQTASLFLIALDAIGRLRQIESETADSQAG